MTKKYQIQKSPFRVSTSDGKIINEHFGSSSILSEISIAHMIAPSHWSEPLQTPEFDEYTYIIRGKKQFTIDGEIVILKAGRSIKIAKGTSIQYSNPFENECEYLSVCFPAFSIDLVHREEI